MSSIIIRLMGGLGNQMFQYAFGKRFEIEEGLNVKYDVVNGFKNDVYNRKYSLDDFNINIVKSDIHDNPIGINWHSPWNLLAKYAWLSIPRKWRNVNYERKQFQYDMEIFRNTNKSTYYYGYWQNENYFVSIRNSLLNEFTFKNGENNKYNDLINNICNYNSVSVHIRQYLDLDKYGKVIKQALKYHGACSMDYYNKAISILNNKYSNCVFYLFLTM
jgi:hypothetical protein